MDGKPVVNEYCICNVKVAPYDPGKFEVNGRRFHKACLKQFVSERAVVELENSYGQMSFLKEVIH